MPKKCAICNSKIEESDGKLVGTIIKVKNEKGKEQKIYACSECMKKPDWIEVAVIRAA